MGTSKAYGGLRGKPNWGTLSRAVSRAVGDNHPTPKSLNRVMSGLVSYMGGSSAVSVEHSVGGKSGIRTAQRLGAFLAAVQQNGFVTAVTALPAGERIPDSTYAINVILEACVEKAGLLDDIAASAALRDLLEDIEAGVGALEELGDQFEASIRNYGVEEILVRYFAFYLYEHLCTDFYEKLIKDKGIRETEIFYADLKDFILERTKTVSKHRDLTHVEWLTDEGRELMQEILKDTLKAFEGYED